MSGLDSCSELEWIEVNEGVEGVQEREVECSEAVNPLKELVTTDKLSIGVPTSENTPKTVSQGSKILPPDNKVHSSDKCELKNIRKVVGVNSVSSDLLPKDELIMGIELNNRQIGKVFGVSERAVYKMIHTTHRLASNKLGDVIAFFNSYTPRRRRDKLPVNTTPTTPVQDVKID